MPTESLDNIIDAHDVEMSNINILLIILRAISLGSLIALVALSVVNTDSKNDESSKEEGARLE